MAFNDLPWHQRFQQMGDQAENAFLEALPLGRAVRVGLNRPDVSLHHATPFVLHTPDFYTDQGWLVECMGVGNDQIIKLKKTKYEALLDWNKKQPVAVFVWDSSYKRWLLAPFAAVKLIVARVRRRGDTTAFENDGNVYFPIPFDELALYDDVMVRDATA